jgi:quercetin dioxygenase-like cupin family protein
VDKRIFPDADLPLEILEAGQVSRKIRARGGAMMAVEVFFETGGVGAEHRHPHEQVSYILEGEFRFTIDGKSSVVRTGDSLYMPGSSLHGTVCLAKGRVLDVFTPQREDFLKA